MCEAALTLFPEKYYEKAQNMLQKKDLLGFVSNIYVAIEAAEKNSEMLKKATFFEAEGLFKFNQHKKALESIERALKYNTGKEVFNLKNNLGKVKGYLGELDEAIKIFKDLIDQTEDVSLLTILYINIAWVYLSLDKNDPSEERLTEIEQYLKRAYEYMTSLSNELKWKICNTYSVYYFYCKDYDRAIELLKEAILYCDEKDLSYIYGNMAEIYLKIDDADVSHFIEEYTQKAEVIGQKYKDSIALARTFYIKAMSELKRDQLFTALDTLYLAFEYFKDAEAYPLAFECLVKINQIMSDYKVDRLHALKDSIKAEFNGTPYYKKL